MEDGCNMKKYIYILLLLFLFASCKKSEHEAQRIPLSEQIVGKWELHNIEITKAAVLGEEIIKISIYFSETNTFIIEQMLGSGRPVTYTGLWSMIDDLISGTYSDGNRWASDYKVLIDGDILTLTPSVEAASETQIYKRVE